MSSTFLARASLVYPEKSGDEVEAGVGASRVGGQSQISSRRPRGTVGGEAGRRWAWLMAMRRAVQQAAEGSGITTCPKFRVTKSG